MPLDHSRRLALATLILLLAACAPHPGAGKWASVDPDRSELVRLDVQFNGWADLYRADEAEPAYHCFWAGSGERQVDLTCTPASDPEAEHRFRLTVEENGRARLYRGDTPAGRYARQQP